MEIPRWSNTYPGASVIRCEVEAMVDAVAGTLVETLGGALGGLWLKGSATRPWDSPLDYVPELSDVDFHFRLGEPDPGRPGKHALKLTTEDVLEMHAEIDRRFTAAIADPIHTPRPQILAIDNVESIPGHVPSPLDAVRTLHGPAHIGPSADLDPDVIARNEASRLIASADPNMLKSETLGLLENPGRHLFRTLRALAWHVSPVGARVLCARTGDFERAWSANRTAIVLALAELGEEQLAERIVGYYTSAWRFFLSGWRDADAGRSAFRHAIAMLEAGGIVGRDVLAAS